LKKFRVDFNTGDFKVRYSFLYFYVSIILRTFESFDSVSMED